ncbi:MAG: hypothetical protein V4662_26550 [Verrucomicrobiota bacterium]
MEDISLRAYLTWLADHLYTVHIPVPECQQALLESYLDADKAVLDLSDCLGYSGYMAKVIEEMSAAGQPFSVHHDTELDAWNSLSQDEQADWEEGDYFTSEADYKRLGSEYLASLSVPHHIKHADIPYRAVLAALFKSVHDHGERFKDLDYFYRNFNECASK